jgi:hypothetical protein
LERSEVPPPGEKKLKREKRKKRESVFGDFLGLTLKKIKEGTKGN